MLMYKVFIMATGKLALFEGKADAEKYKAYMEQKGHEVILNQWSWKVDIEK